MTTIPNKEELEKKIGYHFQKAELLTHALTHPSYIDASNYERLEFLGDAVLEFVISDYLYNAYPHDSEGVLTQKRAEIVCSHSLAEVSRRCGLGNYILFGKGELLTGGKEKTSILENVMESLIGAVYLDGGINAARELILNLFRDTMDAQAKAGQRKDYKSQLHETAQKVLKKEVTYELIKTEGPPHRRTFSVALKIGDQKICEGEGASKKEAEQHAAEYAMKHFINN